MPKITHLPSCASLDVAPTADWDDPKYKRAPRCNCGAGKARQANSTGSGTVGTREMLGERIGFGCYRQPIRKPGY